MYTTAFAPAAKVTPVEVEHTVHFIMFDQPAAYDKALDAFLGG
jgi:hypothetical protein